MIKSPDLQKKGNTIRSLKTVLLTIRMMNNTETGTTAIKVSGVWMTITITIDTNEFSFPIKKSEYRRNLSSITSISLENLFMILPTGVVSKNDIGQCIMESNIFWCNLDDALANPVKRKIP